MSTASWRGSAVTCALFLGCLSGCLSGCGQPAVTDFSLAEEPHDRPGQEWDRREYLILPGHVYRLTVSCLLSHSDELVVRSGAFGLEAVRFRPTNDPLDGTGLTVTILGTRVARDRHPLWYSNNTAQAELLGLADEGLSPHRTGALGREQILDRVESSDHYLWRYAERRVVTRYKVEIDLGIAASRKARIAGGEILRLESWPLLEETISLRVEREPGAGFVLVVPNDSPCND